MGETQGGGRERDQQQRAQGAGARGAHMSRARWHISVRFPRSRAYRRSKLAAVGSRATFDGAVASAMKTGPSMVKLYWSRRRRSGAAQPAHVLLCRKQVQRLGCELVTGRHG